MNIFVLSRNPRLNAAYHCDAHVVKMVVETCQLLSTAHAVSGSAVQTDDGYFVASRKIYKPSHVNHPCAVWVRETSSNYNWTSELLFWLLEEYQARYGDSKGKRHSCWELYPALKLTPKIPKGDMTPFVQVMPESCKHKNPVTAYRKYYRTKTFAAWRFTEAPAWFCRL